MNLIELADRVRVAAQAIAPYITKTPLSWAPALSASSGIEVFLKLDNVQVTGSFKIRGAMNKLLSLTEAEAASGVIAASSGNHGMAVSYGAMKLGLDAEVFVPTAAPTHKLETMRRFGAQVRVHGDDCVIAEREARKTAEIRGATYISPYNDLDVIAGQGTAAVEIADVAPDLDAIYVAIGGGGLIGGMGAYLKEVCPGTEIVGCSPLQSPAMHRCLEVGEIIDVPCHATLSDATAGGVEAGAVTFALCQAVVDRSLLVSEADIRSALRRLITEEHLLVEGAAAVATAGCLADAKERGHRRVGIVLCGANIGADTLREVLGAS